MITTACTSDPTDDSLAIRTEDGVVGESGSLQSDSSADDTQSPDGDSDGSGGLAAGDADSGTDAEGTNTGEATSPDQGEDPGGTDGAGSTLEESATDVSGAVGEILVETGEDLTGDALDEHIADRFEAFWFAFDIARAVPTASPETDYPALLELAAGEQLERSHADLKELHRSGEAIRDPQSPAVPGLDADAALRVRIDSVDAGVAELTSCLVNDQVRYDVTTGAEVANNVTTVMAVSTMAKADGAWKLIRSEPVALDQGVGGCWLAAAPDFKH